MKQNICITGGGGFIGSNLADELIKLSHNVIIIDNLSTGKLENINPKAVFYQRDICDNLDDIFNKHQFDYVFHLAAFIDLRKSIENPAACNNVNIWGSKNLIDTCVKHNVKKFIFSSTGGAMFAQFTPQPWSEKTAVAPASPYGQSKLIIEEYLSIMKKLYGLDYCVLRYANVYGPRQSGSYSGIISILINNALNNKQTTIYGDGSASRDFINVKNVVSANILAMKLDGIYHVSTCTEISINKLIDIIGNKLNCNIVYSDKIAGEISSTCLSSQKLQNCGWKPDIDIFTGIEETIKYFSSK
jgi:UDP-glucose 4-epimerase